ncbi:MAG: carboxynorspermidine decarboxylase [SAR324 cluster bacterium]|nr:carboxynorspermidine decarboxylase [SAR324 cluster bacterium]
MTIDIQQIPTPCYVCDEALLRKNLEILKQVQDQTECNILLALKGFSMFSTFPIVREYLRGVATSSLNEARLGFEEFGGMVHMYTPAYKESEFSEIMNYADHLVFNSFEQWKRFRPLVQRSGKKIECGIRINPEHSEVTTEIYDPCQKFSRMGVTQSQFDEQSMGGLTGIHFHNLCEKNSDSLERTWTVVEKKFGHLFSRLEWINLGGGHHITRSDYDLERLCRIIRNIRKKYGLTVFLEPGEAIALNAGILVASVMDTMHNGMDIALLDASATTHMPDVLEMPYRPTIVGAGVPDQYPYLYRLGGTTCLSGDIIGDYSFPQPLKPGDKLVFEDMLHYTMVKNTTFNGVELPSIAIWTKEGKLEVVRKFGYEDYRNRLS